VEAAERDRDPKELKSEGVPMASLKSITSGGQAVIGFTEKMSVIKNLTSIDDMLLKI